MVLVFQILGFLAGGVILACALTADSSSRASLRLAGVGSVVALVAVVVF
jgi:hypothetical protein